jgi:hypothetical protein
VAYFKFNSVMYSMTATEAALLDQVKGGGLRSKMVSLSHKNLPLSMFLETADLGFPAWGGSTTKAASNEHIISSLGLGIIRFSEPDPEPPKESNVKYRCDTEVITAVTLSTGTEKTPKDPAYARFSINGRTYSHTDIYIPEDGSQLAWVKWRTPKEPGYVTITVSSNCDVSSDEIVAEIVDLDKNPPPDPQANDRNDRFRLPSAPNKQNVTSLTWGEWDCWWHEYWVWIPVWDYCDHGEDGGHYVDNGYWEDQGWWDYAWIPYSASLTATMKIKPDEKSPTATASRMKSGYGLNMAVSSQLRSSAPSSDITGMQNVVSYFPEFNYATYWRLLKRLNIGYSATFEFQKNPYSTYNRRTHFSPIWFPDGSYEPYTWLIDSWTRATRS